jgi:Arc/MetJ-type ribon-helix-helix transcriptional regulator
MTRRITVSLADDIGAVVAAQRNQSEFVEQALREKVERQAHLDKLQALFDTGGAPSDADWARAEAFADEVEQFKARHARSASSAA